MAAAAPAAGKEVPEERPKGGTSEGSAAQAPATSLGRAAPTASADVLEVRHEHLRRSHEKLRHGITESVKDSLKKQTDTSHTLNTFISKSMATVAAWIFSQTGFLIISDIGVTHSKPLVHNLICRVIYAVLMTFLVPAARWLISAKVHLAHEKGILADQLQLAQLCLPMFFAWAWKDVVGAGIAMKEAGPFLNFCAELGVAMGVVLVIGLVEMSPCHRRAAKALQEDAPGSNTFFNRLWVISSGLDLAAGFAWNQVLTNALKQVTKHTDTPLFLLMVWVVYFLLVMVVIVTITMRWNHYSLALLEQKEELKKASDDAMQKVELEAAAAAVLSNTKPPASPGARSSPSCGSGLQPSAPSTFDGLSVYGGFSAYLASEVQRETNGVVRHTGQNLMDALTFVYAWAQLDLVNSFFFTYMLTCQSPKACTYQSNFAFACALTLVFTKLSNILKSEKRHSEWNQAASALMQKSLSLNVGWAWSNYCSTAIAHATATSTIGMVETYLLCCCFVWLLISVLHRKFEIERRAWDRHVNEEHMRHGMGDEVVAP